jgi:hypothetical protein
MAGKLPVIIDTRNNNTVAEALKQKLPVLDKVDVATGMFEVGSFLQLEGLWQTVQNIRVLMGDETTRTTRSVIVKAMLAASNASIEVAKEKDDSLIGLDAVCQAIIVGKIAMRVYDRARFHAKAYRTHAGFHGCGAFPFGAARCV